MDCSKHEQSIIACAASHSLLRPTRMNSAASLRSALPSDWKAATLLGRAWIPDRLAGPSPVTVGPDGTVIDLAPIFPTVSAWLERDDPAAAVRTAQGRAIGSIDALLANSRPDLDAQKPHLLAPCDLQAIKAAGVTFVSSTLEQVDWNAELLRGDLGKAVQQLKRESGKDCSWEV